METVVDGESLFLEFLNGTLEMVGEVALDGGLIVPGVVTVGVKGQGAVVDILSLLNRWQLHFIIK